MAKNARFILILTLITLVVWVVYQLVKIQTSSTIPEPTKEQMRTLDPSIDQKVFEELRSATQ